MKTRDQICKGEGAKLLRVITTYHALQYEQVLQLFALNKYSMNFLIASLIKQGWIYHDKEAGLLCDKPDSVVSPNYGTIAVFWILLDK